MAPDWNYRPMQRRPLLALLVVFVFVVLPVALLLFLAMSIDL
jgi:hypothetical protein